MIYIYIYRKRTACGVMVIVAVNGHCDTSSNPGRDYLPFTKVKTLGKGINPTILTPGMGK